MIRCSGRSAVGRAGGEGGRWQGDGGGYVDARVLERSKQQPLGRDLTMAKVEPKGLKCCLMGTRGLLKETRTRRTEGCLSACLAELYFGRIIDFHAVE